MHITGVNIGLNITVATLAERPDLADQMWNMPNNWPTFMQQDPIADVYFPRLPEVFPEYQLVGFTDDEHVVAKIHSLPFRWAGTDEDLPERGWDAVLERGFTGYDREIQPTAVSLLEARIVPAHVGTGLSPRMLQAAAANARRLGFSDLFGPVRPTMKSLEPAVPMSEYLARLRPDGLPADPWVRTHVRLGARIVQICPISMTVSGTLAQWRDWTGLPLTSSGPTRIPGALIPVHVSVEHDHAVYVEPNVWMHHALGPVTSAADS